MKKQWEFSNETRRDYFQLRSPVIVFSVSKIEISLWEMNLNIPTLKIRVNLWARQGICQSRDHISLVDTELNLIEACLGSLCPMFIIVQRKS